VFSLSIVIPTYNGLYHLQRCLPSVRQLAPPGTQIIVVDDASTDGTASWLREHYPEVELISLATNQGFCRAANLGLECARGDIVELLNNDTEVCPGWADAALRHFADPTIGSVAPLVLRMDDPSEIDSCGQDYHLCGWAIARGYRQRLQPQHLVRRDVFGPSGSSGFYRRAVLDRTGGFLPDYEAYLEDTDLAFRLRWAGYRCIYEPDARVFHRGSASYNQQSDRVIRLLSRNEEFNFWMNLPMTKLVQGLLPHIGFVLVRALRKATQGRLRPYIEGKLQALAQWRLICQRRREIREMAGPSRSCRRVPVCADVAVVRAGLRWLLRHECR
jgi:GT2 family glycosyltransferase